MIGIWGWGGGGGGGLGYQVNCLKEGESVMISMHVFSSMYLIKFSLISDYMCIISN